MTIDSIDDSLNPFPSPYEIDISGHILQRADMERLRRGINGLLRRNEFFASAEINGVLPLTGTEDFLVQGILDMDHELGEAPEELQRTGKQRISLAQYITTYALLSNLLGKLEDIDSLTFSEYRDMIQECQEMPFPQFPDNRKDGFLIYTFPNLASAAFAGFELNTVTDAERIFSEIALKNADERTKAICGWHIRSEHNWFIDDVDEHMDTAARDYLMGHYAFKAERREKREFFDKERFHALYDEVRLACASKLGFIAERNDVIITILGEYEAGDFQRSSEASLSKAQKIELNHLVETTIRDVAEAMGLESPIRGRNVT